MLHLIETSWTEGKRCQICVRLSVYLKGLRLGITIVYKIQVITIVDDKCCLKGQIYIKWKDIDVYNAKNYFVANK